MFWLTLIMVFIGAFNVITRYIGRELGISLGGTLYIALQTYAYNLVFLLGAAYVLNRDAHVRVDIIYSNLSARAKAWIDIVFTFIFLIPFCTMGIILSHRYVVNSWVQREVNLNAGGIPIYPIKTAIIAAFVLLILQGISEIIKRIDFLRRGGEDPHERVTEQMEAI
jgi:TRAP-type mannitol/chloroaromatic compound transport system permease small subunit